jgi:RNA polymerase sigma-B factor
MSLSGFRSGEPSGKTPRQADQVRDRSRELREQIAAGRDRANEQLGEVHDKLDEARALRTWPRRRGLPWQRRRPVPFDLWLRHVRYARTHDGDDMAALVVHYRPDALRLAHRHHRGAASVPDVEQVALEALVVSLERFDPDRAVPFLGYAVPTISGALKRYYRDHGWALRVPRHVHELAAPAQRAAGELEQQLGREPESTEIADHLGTDVDTFEEAAEAIEARRVGSLEASPVGVDRDADLAVEDERLMGVVNREALRQALTELPPRDREVLFEYFIEEHTQSEIAERHNVSQMQVSRWITSAVGRLRGHIKA